MHDGRTPPSNGANEPFAEADDPVVSAVALLVLGAGLGSLFGLPLLAGVDFWVIFAIGFAVVVPLTSLLRGRGDGAGADESRRERADPDRVADAGTDEDVDSALDRLRDRYARGDLSDDQFERKLETLLETETPEDVRERLDRGTDPDAGDGETERERERGR